MVVGGSKAIDGFCIYYHLQPPLEIYEKSIRVPNDGE